MDRVQQIEAIVGFVSHHPESLASRAICRQVTGPDRNAPHETLREGLASLDEETLTGYYYLVR